MEEQNYKLKGFLTLQGGEGPLSGYPYGPLPTTNLDYYNFFNNSFPISSIFNFGITSGTPSRPTLSNGTSYAGDTLYEFWSDINPQTGTIFNIHCNNWTSTSGNGHTGFHQWNSNYLYFRTTYTNRTCSSAQRLACLEI